MESIVENLKLSRTLFWDIREEDIPRVISDSQDWVVARIFEYGTIDEIFNIIDYYGENKIKQLLLNATSTKPVTRSMAKAFLNLHL